MIACANKRISFSMCSCKTNRRVAGVRPISEPAHFRLISAYERLDESDEDFGRLSFELAGNRSRAVESISFSIRDDREQILRFRIILASIPEHWSALVKYPSAIDVV